MKYRLKFLATPLACICVTSLLIACSPRGPSGSEDAVEPENQAAATAAEPYHHLRVSTLDDDRHLALEVAKVIEIEGESFRVESIRAWSGLLRQPDGNPMASLSVRKPAGEWLEDILVGADSWLRVEGYPPLLFLYVIDEEPLRETLAKSLDAVSPGRWGVLDGGRTQWFDGFVTGTGVERADGSRVTLMEYAPARGELDKPSIRVRVQSGESSIDRWVASSETDDADVRLELNPLLTETVVVMANRAARAEVFQVRKGTIAASQELSAGESWSIPGELMELRVEQIVPGAVPVLREQSPLLEAVLVGANRRLRVRQGESIRVGETTLRFVRNTDLH